MPKELPSSLSLSMHFMAGRDTFEAVLTTKSLLCSNRIICKLPPAMTRACFRLFIPATLLLFVTIRVLCVELLPPGFRPLPLGVHALVGGEVVVKPGEGLESGA